MKITVTYIFLFLALNLIAQKNQLTHLSGTEKVNGVQVTVRSKGSVSQNTSYCESSQPYHIGSDQPIIGNGSYIFEFEPAVTEVILNFSAISSSDATYHEEVIIRKNGKHYKVPYAGKDNGCDKLAIINKRGNIAPCQNCNGAGFNGLVIPGPIKKIELKDSVIFGSPAGTLFSIFIGDPIKKMEHKEVKSVRALRLIPHQNNSDFIKVIGWPDQEAMLEVKNEKGKILKEMTQKVKNGESIDVSSLPPGYYIFILYSDAYREERSVIIE